ncbi:class I SAM-dependent methyltransferase [Candidatus Gottesmanbacteria bacterium]|nr:class I SAM-dependent methyltransferase [Candidatus Gottesmanbacteria bacterium]
MKRRTPKYLTYQDYVIKDGIFIGEFERLYQDYDDPWFQSVKEREAPDKTIALHLIKKLKIKKVIELGCGLGYFTNEIGKIGVEVLGIDISRTAIRKARSMFPMCRFLTCDVLNYGIYRSFQPNLIVMAS